MYTKIRIDLLLEDFADDPQIITSYLGVQPKTTHIKGEQIEGRPESTWSKNTWLISSGIDEDESFESHLGSIMNEIDSKYSRFLELSGKCNIYLNCVIKMYEGDRPFISFDKRTIKKLGELNAEIEFDLYNY